MDDLPLAVPKTEPLPVLVKDWAENFVHSLGRLPPRVRSVIEREELVSIGQLAEWAERVDVAREPNYGRHTHRLLIERLQALSQQGVSRLVFGLDSPPVTAGALFNAWLDSLTGAHTRRVIHARYIEMRTLDEIGQEREPPVTRERVRQIIERELAQDRPAWGPAARRILAPARALLENGGGVALLDSCLRAVGADHVGALLLCADLADVHLSVPSDGKAGYVSVLSSEELRAFRSQLREDVERVLLEGSSLEPVRATLKEHGIELAPDEESRFLSLFLGVEVRDGVATSGRRPVQSLVVRVLRAAGGALRASELAERVLAEEPDAVANPHSVVVHLSRTQDVFNLGGGRWVHIDHLGVSRADLERIADACLELVPQNGVVVNVTTLLRRVAQTLEIPPSLSPWTVRDALLHTKKVRGWRAGCQVAWRESAAARRSVAEWIEEVAPSMEQPFRFDELVSTLEAFSGNKQESIAMQAHQSRALLLLGGGEYVARSSFFPDDAAWDAACAEIKAAIPLDDVVSAPALARSSVLADVHAPPRVRASLAWAVARAMPSMESRIAGRLVWRASHAGTCWDALRRGRSYDLGPRFRVHDLSHWLQRRHSVMSDQLAYVLVREARHAGALVVDADGLYCDAGT